MSYIKTYNEHLGGIMGFIKKFLSVFLVCLAFQGMLSAVDQGDRNLVRVDLSNPIMITEHGHYIMDENSKALIPIQGYVDQNNETYVIVDEYAKAALCGHFYGCKVCMGCIVPGCWNYCPGCRK